VGGFEYNMKLYLVRHAESKRNAHEENTEEDTELTEVGIEQARRLGKYFHDKKIDFVFCSDLKRAKGTLNEILPYIKKSKVIYSKEIRELDLGIFQKNGEDNWRTWARVMRESGKGYENFRPEGGESFSDVFNRAVKFYKLLNSKYKDKNILVVSHGFFLLYLILNILNLSISEGAYYKLSNAGVSSFFINKKGKVNTFHINDFHHLVLGGMKK
jgi:broad specificity phosphatase PhoE